MNPLHEICGEEEFRARLSNFCVVVCSAVRTIYCTCKPGSFPLPIATKPSHKKAYQELLERHSGCASKISLARHNKAAFNIQQPHSNQTKHGSQPSKHPCVAPTFCIPKPTTTLTPQPHSQPRPLPNRLLDPRPPRHNHYDPTLRSRPHHPIPPPHLPPQLTHLLLSRRYLVPLEIDLKPCSPADIVVRGRSGCDSPALQ